MLFSDAALRAAMEWKPKENQHNLLLVLVLVLVLVLGGPSPITTIAVFDAVTL